MQYIKIKNKLGESPIYHNFHKKFFWIDILDNKLFSFDDKIITLELNFSPCCIQEENNNLLMASENEIGIFDLRQNQFNKILKMDFPKNIRFNDGRKDNNNDFFIGTMDKNEKDFDGKIYKFKNNYLEIIKENIGISNGIAFNENNEMYYSDSLDKKLFFKNSIIKKYENECPDGGIFINNNYINCIWNGNRIDFFENNKLKKEINIELDNPTCPAFYNNKLFITSSSLINNTGNNGDVLIINNIF